jgi:hypothetical protein
MENIFNLKNNYTKNELTSKFNQKINEINNLNISLIDKNLLIERYDKEYKTLLNNFFINNIFNTFRNLEMPQIIPENHISPNLIKQSNLPQINYSTSYSYSSQVNPNGIKTVYQHNKINNNGIINEVTNQYKIDKNGNKIYCNRY